MEVNEKKWLFPRIIFRFLYPNPNFFSKKKKLTLVDKCAMLTFKFSFWACILVDTSPILVVKFAMLSPIWPSKWDSRSDNFVITFFNLVSFESSLIVFEDTCSNNNDTANMTQRAIDVMFICWGKERFRKCLIFRI